MGDIPAQIKIVCPGCNTQFRLKPKKGRLPKEAIPCPRCGEEIPVVEANLSHDDESTQDRSASGAFGASPAPESNIIHSNPSETPVSGTDAARPRRATATGAPRLSHRSTPLDEDDFAHLDIMPGLTDSSPRSTYLGMGAGLMAIDASRKKKTSKFTDEHTKVVDGSLVDQVLKADDGAQSDASGFKQESTTKPNTKPLPEEFRVSSDAGLAETSEQNALDRATLKERLAPTHKNRSAKKTLDLSDEALLASQNETKPPFDLDPDPTSEVPKQMVLGRIKIKQKLQQKLKKDTSPDAGEALVPEQTKPSLATLLKKARERKIDLPSPSEASSDRISALPKRSAKPRNSADLARRKSAAALDRALNSLADETARALDGKKRTGTTKMYSVASAPDQDALAYDTGDSSMIDLLRRRVAENQQPGAASERRGSGYIRLPTAEIQDVLGQGTYRLRVEEIIYEPIDKAGLTELVKRGVLMGAAEIAQSDGDWMPIGEHPVLADLRQKMAAEAHEMLSTLARAPLPRASQSGAAPLPKPASSGRLFERFDGADDFADLKDSTEIAAIPSLSQSLTDSLSGDSDFETVNSGLFADVDALRHAEPRKKVVTEKLYSASDISLDEPASDTAAQADSAPLPLAESPDAAAEVNTTESNDAGDAATQITQADSTHTESPSTVDLAESSEPAPSLPEGFADSAPALQPEEPAEEEEDGLDYFEDAPIPSGAGGKKAGIIVGLLIMAAVVGLAISPFGQPYIQKAKDALASKGASDSKPVVGDNGDAPKDESQAASGAVAPAVDAARAEVESAADVELDTPQSQDELAAELIADGDHAGAADIMRFLWQERGEDADFAKRYVTVLVDAQRFSAAGEVAIAAMLTANANGDEEAAREFETLFKQSIEKNPELGAYKTVDISAEAGVDAATLALHGKKNNRLAIHLSTGQKPAFVFEPAQAQFERDWRMAIASWRLCQMMVCNFEVPRARPARIERAAFQKLVGEAPGEHADKLGALNWVKEDDGEYLYGALIDALDAPARFPIERISLWRPWLAPGSADDLEMPLAEGLASLKSLEDDFYTPLLAQANDVTLARLAAQLSSVLLVDYLTNNWDRFSPTAAGWGNQLGLRDGVLVSTANMGAFQPRSSTRIKGRFDWTSRFSKATVASLRLIDRELAAERLFPAPNAGERVRVDLFWSQRALALERINSLVAARGEKEVLRFE
ncbi:hypothetical protein [Bradymonas sediminis]|uniref:Uncharacterized protein n=1 Tax=Bradymonas sediminis TaxID=1548548 RepID=A0A2Z4FJI4_9DELT|nr:hypothetical protein [Bradymonas sediminis]AWV89089.1 hypothetical protein DN745_06965 [Bradymonas sediminis]TDP64447.1 hypothetical protein DFR33_109108 [Bradymonas sediminis]